MCPFCLVVERREEHIFRSNLECVVVIGIKLHWVALFFLGIKKDFQTLVFGGGFFFVPGTADTVCGKWQSESFLCSYQF